MTWQDELDDEIKRDEGYSNDLYEDSRGFWSIGIGRCLQTKPLKDDEVAYLYSNDKKDATENAIRYFQGFWDLTDERKKVLVNMAYQLGLGGLSEFIKLNAAMVQKNWAQASQEILNSKLAPARRQRLASRMLSG